MVENTYSIKLPIFALESKGDMKLILQELNNCFLLYKNEYNLVPDVIVFSGTNGSKIGKLVDHIFNSVYNVQIKEAGPDVVIFKSSKKNNIVMSKERGIKAGSSLDGKMVNGFCTPNMGDFIQFSYTEERNVETIMDFDIKIF